MKINDTLARMFRDSNTNRDSRLATNMVGAIAASRRRGEQDLTAFVELGEDD
jgi:hypothetical protein